MSLTPKKIYALCKQAIAEAKLSIREDERVHPLVGALIADDDGNILVRAHRGETLKRHAEYCLLEKANAQGINTKMCTLFVTLEPCIRRGPDKIPCAVRVANAGIQRVFIGTLDPDPNITGRGTMYLTYEQLRVEHFPADLSEELRRINLAFFERFRAAHFWDPPPMSLYGAGMVEGAERPQAAKTREGILYQSLDLITASTGAIWISAGDLSWLRELQVGLIGAAIDEREIRLIQQYNESTDALANVASWLGVSVARRDQRSRIRFTLVGVGTADMAAVVIEPSHAILLRTPDEVGIIEVIHEWFDRAWNEKHAVVPHAIEFRELSFDRVVAALRTYVPQYRSISIQLENVVLNNLRPATNTLEAFKLFRINQFVALRKRLELPLFTEIVGSPWPLISTPLVERLPDGSMVLIDGTHRAYSERARGQTTITAIVIDNPNYDLPSQPAQNWNSIEILSLKLSRDRRYRKYEPTLFRPIRRAYESLVLPGSGY